MTLTLFCTFFTCTTAKKLFAQILIASATALLPALAIGNIGIPWRVIKVPSSGLKDITFNYISIVHHKHPPQNRLLFCPTIRFQWPRPKSKGNPTAHDNFTTSIRHYQWRPKIKIRYMGIGRQLIPPRVRGNISGHGRFRLVQGILRKARCAPFSIVNGMMSKIVQHCHILFCAQKKKWCHWEFGGYIRVSE